MPNPRAQKPLSYDQIVKDAKSLGVPAQALLDALAGGLKGSVTATVGAPADIYNLINQASFRGQLPNIPLGSEDIAKMLPDVIPTQDKSRQHTAEVGELAGSFIPTPMAGQAVKGAVKLGKVGARALGEELGRRAVMGESFTPLMNTALPMTHVMKNKGGNWVGDTVERGLEGLKSETGSGTPAQMVDFIERQLKNPDLGEEGKEVLRRQLPQYHKESAINNWVDKNLTNYVKKEMATPEDPVRKLAEQGITHLPDNGIDYINQSVPERLALSRMKAGFPSMGIGQSNLAKGWENLADSFITSYPAKEYTKPLTKSEISRGRKSVVPENPWLTKLDPETQVTYLNTPRALSSDLGFTHIMDVLKQDLENGRLRPESLKNVSMEQAVRRAHEYDQEMAKKMAEAQIKMTEGMPIHKEYPTGHKWIELKTPDTGDKTKLPEGYLIKQDKNDMEPAPYYLYGPNRDVINGKHSIYHATPEEAIESAHRNESNQKLADALKYEGETMGHCVGGYCPDVIAGRSRIFSLRDAKGEPHVTVEVNKDRDAPSFYEQNQKLLESPQFKEKHDYLNNESDSPDQYINGMTKLFKESGLVEGKDYFVPPQVTENIVQIKGKQNLAPKEQYLPFVQDFVKSGNWGEVGDLGNTGLITTDEFHPDTLNKLGIKLPKYLTPQEKSDLNNHIYNFQPNNPNTHTLPESIQPFKIQPEPPVEGMKKGGAVTISDNPDTMFMEVMDKKMAGGGAVAKIAKALAKEQELMKASEALGKIEGRPLVVTQADRTKVGGGYLGGPGFSGIQHTNPEYKSAEATWGVKTPGVAKMILGGGQKAGENPVYSTMIGSPTQHQSNQMVFDKLYKDFMLANKRGELDPELRDLINERLIKAIDKEKNPIFPSDVDITSKDFKKIANTFDRRSIAGHLMGGVGVGGKKGQVIDYDKIIRSTTDPALLDVPSGSIGNRLFTLSGGIVDRPDLHPAFPSILQGEDLGLTFNPVPRELLMKDFIEKTKAEKGRDPGYMDYTRGYPPSQLITEELLTELQKKGYKKGGAIKKAQGGEISEDDIQMEVRPL